MEICSTSFCWTPNSFTSDTWSHEDFRFLSLFSIPILCLKHVLQLFWNLVTCKPLIREFHHPPSLIVSCLPQFHIWIQDSLHNLVFGILINRTKISPKTWCHMDSKMGIEIEKILLIPLPNACLPFLDSFLWWNHLQCQMLCCL